MDIRIPRLQPQPLQPGEMRESLSKIQAHTEIFQVQTDPSQEQAKSSMIPTNQPYSAGTKEQPQAQGSHQNDDAPTIPRRVNAQPDSQAAKTSNKAENIQCEDNRQGDKGSRGSSEGEQLRGPVYYQQPGESSHDAQARYINAFDEYTMKMAAYRQRTKGRLVRKLEGEFKQPPEDSGLKRRCQA